MSKNKKSKLNPHTNFILGRACMQCEEDHHEHDGHIQAYLHEPGSEETSGGKRLMVFSSKGDAYQYILETFPEDESEISIIPLSEATFGNALEPGEEEDE